MSIVIVWIVGFCALLVSYLLQRLGRDMLILVACAIDRSDEPPEMQVWPLLGHVPDRGPDATGDGGRGEASAD